ncbi:amidase [Streptomyces albireticuli]|uniref:amidase n=1 Tax=Streptomyces albireticuli TaxID=1940 RepID=UPI001E3DC5D0|nr:amidase [Streptomyces albireticuli]MCD9141389.1 amidase [Streptomyces albireticuli]MCD9160650.1 amidase [Streptomyces albireticuli]MCD9195794.1 amidase [Streptomyces albireticuli]
MTSVGLTEAAVVAAERADGALGVYLTRFVEQAREAARRADEELARGIDRGPLHGIPVGVKDTIAVADGPTTAQSLVHDRGWWAGRDAPVVARLRAAGAVITGKTTAMEFGCGLPEEDKPFPLPRNPWRTESWAGGSSSGSASGVVAGMFLAGLGSDTGGSIRMPAAFCGVSGLMPTYGRVPVAGCVPLAYSLDRVGPLARSAADCAAVLGVIAGEHDGVGATSCQAFFHASFHASCYDTGCGEGLDGLRIGVVREHHFPADGDPSLPGAFDEAVSVLAGLGAVPVEIRLPYWQEMITTTFVTAAGEGLAHHRTALSRHWDDYGVAARGLLATGALISGADYVQAQRVRTVAQRAVDALFADVDVIVCPTASVGAPPFTALADEAGHQDHAGVFGKIYTPYWNPLANPVLAVPMGRTAAGLPLSMQIAGPVAGEAAILRVGDAFQRHTDWHRRIPDLSVTVTAAPHARAAMGRGEHHRGEGIATQPDAAVTVRSLLAAAGLPAGEREITGFEAAYLAQRPAVDGLFDVPEAGDVRPVLRPDATVRPDGEELV